MTNRAGAYCKMVEAKKAKVRKGWLTVDVGVCDEDDGSIGCNGRRFTIPLYYLHQPLFLRLLEAAQEAYGYRSTGPLRLPCSVDEFLHIQWAIENELQHRRAGDRNQLSLSFHSC